MSQNSSQFEEQDQNNDYSEADQYDIDVLKMKLKKSKEPDFQNTEQEVKQYINRIKREKCQQIDNILAGHKDRMFASELQIDPESKLFKSQSNSNKQYTKSDKVKFSDSIQSQYSQEFQQNETITQKQQNSQKKERGAMWRAQNRDHADFEHQFKDYLKDKAEAILNPPVKIVQKKYEPIIVKTNEKTEYEKGVDDSEIGSEYSALSDFAYKTAAEIMEAYHHVFETQDKQDIIRTIRIKDFKDDEIYLLTSFYQLVRKKSSQKELISKEELEKYLLQNPYILQMYNIAPDDLNKIINEMPTRKQNLVSRQEMIEMLLNPTRPSLKQFDASQAEALLKNRPVQTIHKSFILKDIDFKKITDVFVNLDTFGDHRIQVKQLIHNLRMDPKVKQILPKPAIYIKSVKKCIPVERLFFEIEQQMYHAPTEALRKERSTITWEQFFDFFQNYHRKDIPSKDEIIKAQRLTGKFDSGDVIELPKEFISILKQVYNECDKTAECFVRKFEFSDELRQHCQFQDFKRHLVREQEYNGQHVEDVERTLGRLVLEADEFIDLDEIIDFFTRKGRPIVIEKAFQEQREKIRREKALNQWNREEFSSPDEKELKDKRKQRKIAKINGLKEAKKIKKNIDSEKEKIQGKSFGAIYKDSEEGFKITVPQPFNFDKRDKNRKEFIVERRLKEDLAAKKAAEDEIVQKPGQWRANKVPKHVKDRNLLAKIEKKQEKRRQEVQKHSKTMTKLNENPFSFYYRDIDKKTKYHCFDPEEEKALQYQHYQAKPAPWFTRVLMLERMYREQEAKSQAYIQKRMQELKEMSHLPEGVKHMMERLQAKEEERRKMQDQLPSEFTFQPPRAKPIPDFEQLQKEFQENLDEHKQSKSLTIPREFNFQETRKAPKRDYLDEENKLMKKMKEIPDSWYTRDKKIEKLKNITPKYLPPSTKKFDAMVEKRKREEELKYLENEDKLQREYDKENRREQFAKFVRSSGAIIDNTNKLDEARYVKTMQRKEEQYQWQQQFDSLMTNMMKRVIRKPLLVEAQSEGNFGSDRVSRLKWLLGEVEEQDEEYETENYQQNPQAYNQEQQQMYEEQYNQQQREMQMQQQQYINEMDEQEQEEYEQQQDQYDQNQYQQENVDEQQIEEDKLQQQYDPQNYQQQQIDEQYEGNEYDDEQQDSQQKQQEQIQIQDENMQEQQYQGDDDEEIDYLQQQQMQLQQQQLLDGQQDDMNGEGEEMSEPQQDQFYQQEDNMEQEQYDYQQDDEEGLMDGNISLKDFTSEQKAQVIQQLREQGIDITEEQFDAQLQLEAQEEEDEEDDDGLQQHQQGVEMQYQGQVDDQDADYEPQEQYRKQNSF